MLELVVEVIESPPRAEVKSPNEFVVAGLVAGADIDNEDKSLKALMLDDGGEDDVSGGLETTGAAAGAGFGA